MMIIGLLLPLPPPPHPPISPWKVLKCWGEHIRPIFDFNYAIQKRHLRYYLYRITGFSNVQIKYISYTCEKHGTLPIILACARPSNSRVVAKIKLTRARSGDQGAIALFLPTPRTFTIDCASIIFGIIRLYQQNFHVFPEKSTASIICFSG